jgi:iron only hydrogenase large subunit-like protein
VESPTIFEAVCVNKAAINGDCYYQLRARNETKRNETKRNETKRNETRERHDKLTIIPSFAEFTFQTLAHEWLLAFSEYQTQWKADG